MDKVSKEVLALGAKKIVLRLKKEYSPFGFFSTFCTTVAECNVLLMLKSNVKCAGKSLFSPVFL